jgi:hypothetical protein
MHPDRRRQLSEVVDAVLMGILLGLVITLAVEAFIVVIMLLLAAYG